MCYLAAVVFLLSLGAAGCLGKKPEQKPVQPPLKIAVSFADIERDGNKIIKKVMESRKKEEKIDISFLDARNDSRTQEQQLEKAIKEKVKAVVLQPVDPAGTAAIMKKMVGKKVKLVAVETMPLAAPVDAYITSDHALSGQLMVKFVADAVMGARVIQVPPESPQSPEKVRAQQLGAAAQGPQGGSQTGGQGGAQQGGQAQQQSGQGTAPGGVLKPESQLAGRSVANVVVLSGDPNDMAAREITDAIRAAAQGRKEISLLKVYDHYGGKPSGVAANMQDALLSTGSRVDAVLATDSRLALAAVDILKSAGLNNKVLTVGVGADKRASMELAKGEHDAEIDTRPDLLGQYALDAAMELAKGDHWSYSGQSVNGNYSVPSRITPVRLITPDNAYLLNQRWGGMQGGKKEGGGQGAKSQGQGGEQGSAGGSGGSSQGQEGSQQGQGGGQQGQGGSQQGGKGKTKLKITTMDGKTMEMEIDGEVKKIESVGGGGQGQGQGGQAGGQGQ